MANTISEVEEDCLARLHTSHAAEVVSCGSVKQSPILCRWAENDRARLSALEAMNTMVERKLEEISEMTATPTSQLKFLSDAWAQVCDEYQLTPSQCHCLMSNPIQHWMRCLATHIPSQRNLRGLGPGPRGARALHTVWRVAGGRDSEAVHLNLHESHQPPASPQGLCLGLNQQALACVLRQRVRHRPTSAEHCPPTVEVCSELRYLGGAHSSYSCLPHV